MEIVKELELNGLGSSGSPPNGHSGIALGMIPHSTSGSSLSERIRQASSNYAAQGESAGDEDDEVF